LIDRLKRYKFNTNTNLKLKLHMIMKRVIAYNYTGRNTETGRPSAKFAPLQQTHF